MVRGILTATALIGLVASESRSTAAQGTAPTRYELATAGNEARYRVRERLMGIDFPNDAFGRTSAITGALVVDATGKVLADRAKISVDLTTLKSDSDRRDRIIQNNPLQTAQFPRTNLTVKTFIPRGMRALTVENDITLEYDFHLIPQTLAHRSRTSFRLKESHA